ncbi:MAG: low molecular weight phosphatase family protein [Rhodothalassiaceae bacterium]
MSQGRKMGDRPGILFLCSRNAVRSPMAHALALRHFAHRRPVTSAGLEPGELDPFAVAVMAEIGLDISGHRPHGLREIATGSQGTLVALSEEAKEAADRLEMPSGLVRLFWPISDPAREEGNREQRMAAYRTVRDELDRRISDAFPIAG